MNIDFLRALNYYMTLVFDNEVEFLANFWDGDPDRFELLDFTMGPTLCEVRVVSIDGRHIVNSISTAEFLEWAEDMKEP